jgi:hypothetical protein
MTTREPTDHAMRLVWIQTLAYYLADVGACARQAPLWDRTERLYAEARTQHQAWEAARPAIAVCTTCTAVRECRNWAIADRYTGLAAAQAWVDGHPQTKPRQPPSTNAKRAKSRVL